ncbi:hypothetical protein MARPO_0030s0058 [Marchantia polymorpha]|uniref:Uncharacterized protein n=1 Tax=Marchantia polymorpha TaxID=3197 RepID=A0A2R6X898_MARPO|nr:hypothetical protein MARPO_0030s0058 [Marchantia polymorpha]|eukprot:PTQ42313.1 hypothetical protein MARPO_0030s0058 [Marchantia polymorpha]
MHSITVCAASHTSVAPSFSFSLRVFRKVQDFLGFPESAAVSLLHLGSGIPRPGASVFSNNSFVVARFVSYFVAWTLLF